MLTDEEKEFCSYWAAAREREAKFSRKLVAGLPFAALFSFPILLLVICVYLFLPDWYAKISGTSASTMFAAVAGVVISTLFFSYFRMHFKWEMNEQLYLELKQKMRAA